MSSAPEFDLIERLKPAAVDEGPSKGVALGIGDDAAIVRPTPGCRLACCTDMLIAGVHFPLATEPSDIAHKSLAVNLSDLAAMGARPRWALLSLALNQPDSTWVDAFAAGWRGLAEPMGVALVGGDTSATPGPVSVTVQLIGELPADRALTRSGAAAGDLIAVTGTLGGAALALAQVLAGQAPPPALLRRLNRPTPRVEAGLALLGLATACIDLSDGLAADLAHLLEASGTGARVSLEDLPLHPSVAALDGQRRLDLALGGGDDYELCFCFPGGSLDRVTRALAEIELPFAVIGQMRQAPGIEWAGAAGRTVPRGFTHFA